MAVASGIAFLGLAGLFLVLASLALLRIGFGRLESSAGIARDGLRLGKNAPRWRYPDVEGVMRQTPAGDRWQLLLFGDHSLASFPALVAGLNHIAESEPNLEVLVISRDSPEHCASTARALGLHVPIVPTDQAFYRRFGVRVMPFAHFLNPHGTVKWIGLVNSESQLMTQWRMARSGSIDLGAAEGATV